MKLWGAGDTAIIETIDLCFPRYDQLRRNNDISVLFWPIHSEGNLFWVTGGLQGTSGPMRGWDQGEGSFQAGRCREEGHFFVRRAPLGCTSESFLFFFSFEAFKQVWSSAAFTVRKETPIISFAFLPGANSGHGEEFYIRGLGPLTPRAKEVFAFMSPVCFHWSESCKHAFDSIETLHTGARLSTNQERHKASSAAKPLALSGTLSLTHQPSVSPPGISFSVLVLKGLNPGAHIRLSSSVIRLKPNWLNCFKLKRWVCVTQLLLWLRLVYHGYTRLLFSRPCKWPSRCIALYRLCSRLVWHTYIHT